MQMQMNRTLMFGSGFPIFQIYQVHSKTYKLYHCLLSHVESCHIIGIHLKGPSGSGVKLGCHYLLFFIVMRIAGLGYTWKHTHLSKNVSAISANSIASISSLFLPLWLVLYPLFLNPPYFRLPKARFFSKCKKKQLMFQAKVSGT